MKPAPHPRLSGLARRREKHKQRHFLVRAGVVLAGFALFALGGLMLLLPGPAFVVLPLGLGLLALEFSWAENSLARVLHLGERAAAHARKPRGRGRQALVIFSSAYSYWVGWHWARYSPLVSSA